MKISWLGTAWAAIKGAFSFGSSAAISVVDYILDSAYRWYSDIDGVMANIQKAHAGLVAVCDKLDYYRKYIPAPWTTHYSSVCTVLGTLRDTIADGRFERAEIEKIVEDVKSAIEEWRK